MLRNTQITLHITLKSISSGGQVKGLTSLHKWADDPLRNNVQEAVGASSHAAQQRHYALLYDCLKSIRSCFREHTRRTAMPQQLQQHPEHAIVLDP